MKVRKTLQDISLSWFKGQAFKKTDITLDGKYKCIHYGELFSKYGAIIDSASSLTNEEPVKVSEYGDILFPASDVTPAGLTKCSAIRESGVILGGDIIAMRPKGGFNPVYLAYAIRFQKEQLLSRVTGALIKHLSAKALQTVSIPIVDLELQNKFEIEIRKLTSIVKNLQSLLRKLDELAKARFVEMFGEPITLQNKAAVQIGGVGTVLTGNTPPMKNADYYDSDDIMFVKPCDIGEESVTYISKTKDYISEKARAVSRIFPAKSVLVTCIGTIGKVGISMEAATCNQQINVIIPNERVNYLYLAHCILYMRNIFKDNANAPVVPILNKGDFSKVRLPLPGLDKQNEYAQFIRQLDKSRFAVQHGEKDFLCLLHVNIKKIT